LLVEGEFPSNIYPFLNLRKRGVSIDFLPQTGQAIDPDVLIKNLHPETRLFSVSFVGFLYGCRNDLKTLGDICRQHNVIYSVDGIQGVGACPVDVREAGVDFMSNGGHKWLMGPQGCGFMYISPALFERLQPSSVGWLSVKDSWNFLDYRLELLEDAGRFEIGTANVAGIYGLRAATDLLLEVGIDEIHRHIIHLGDILIEQLETLGFFYQGPRERNHRSGIHSFHVRDEQRVFRQLRDNNIHLSLRNNLLRFSPHFYNTSDEMIKVIDVCKTVLNRSL
jgi:selenocysteine lyase/cysteine desulfurase